MIATFLPNYAARTAAFSPAGPAPITATSKSRAFASSTTSGYAVAVVAACAAFESGNPSASRCAR